MVNEVFQFVLMGKDTFYPKLYFVPFALNDISYVPLSTKVSQKLRQIAIPSPQRDHMMGPALRYALGLQQVDVADAIYTFFLFVSLNQICRLLPVSCILSSGY